LDDIWHLTYCAHTNSRIHTRANKYVSNSGQNITSAITTKLRQQIKVTMDKKRGRRAAEQQQQQQQQQNIMRRVSDFSADCIAR